MDIRVIKPVHVSVKATLYANDRRSGFTEPELIQLIQGNRGVYLGSTNVDFILVWDHHKKRPTVLLVARGFTHDTIVSIWGPHYHGVPNGHPTSDQIALARALALKN
jgi:hypothetical protein